MVHFAAKGHANLLLYMPRNNIGIRIMTLKPAVTAPCERNAEESKVEVKGTATIQQGRRYQ